MSDPLDIHKNQVHQYWNFSLDLSQTMIDVSPSKRAFEKFKPWGLFSEFYGMVYIKGFESLRLIPVYKFQASTQ